MASPYFSAGSIGHGNGSTISTEDSNESSPSNKLSQIIASHASSEQIDSEPTDALIKGVIVNVDQLRNISSTPDLCSLKRKKRPKFSMKCSDTDMF